MAEAADLDGKPREQTLAWASTAVGLFAITAYALFRREPLYSGIVALLFFAPHALGLRFRNWSFLLMVFRLLMYGHALIAGVYAPPIAHSLTPLGDYVQAFTRICMAELAIQPWISSVGLAHARRDAAVILLSCFTFAEASKTIDVSGTFPYLYALPFFLLMAAALKNLRRRSTEPVQPMFAPRAWIHVPLLVLALGAGISTSLVVRDNKASLNQFRFTGGLVAPTAASTSTVAFTTAPVLGPRQNTARSMQRVLRVSGMLPRGGYLRGLSFHTYMLAHWDPPGESRAFAAVAPESLVDSALTGARNVTITRLTDEIPYLFLPLNTKSLQTQATELRQQVGGVGAGAGVGGDAFQCYESPPFKYTATTTDAAFKDGLLSAAPDGAQRRRLLMVPPEIDPGVVWLGKNLTGRIRDPIEKIRAVETYLRKEHTYSLEVQLSGADPISDFVLHKRPGHCELFASAATMLLRAGGVPTRYVTGYYVHEPQGQSWIVRQQDAHAWAESYIDGAGWVTVDGTPESGLPFKMGEQASMWRGIGETIGDWFGAVVQFVKTWRGFEWTMASMIALLLAGAIWWRRHRARLRRRIAHVHVYVIPEPKLADLAVRFEQRLMALNTPCPPQKTWQEHLEELLSRSELPANRTELESAAAFAKAYSAVRFGKPMDKAAVEELLGASR